MAATTLADSWSVGAAKTEGITQPDCRLHS
jgi:hypothetical protein